MQTQQQWSDRAIAWTTSAILGLYSVVTLLAHQLLISQAITIRRAAWYRKDCATFSDTIALVRRWLWHADNLALCQKPPDLLEIPTNLFLRLTDTISYAA